MPGRLPKDGAQPEDEGDKGKHEGVIEKFRRLYNQQLGEAHDSSETTQTGGWQSMYHANVRDKRKERHEAAKTLRTLADALEDRGLTEEQGKELGGIKKLAEDLRDDDAAWEKRVVGPITKPVRECDKLIEDAIAEAQRVEANEPMFAKGLVNKLKLAVQNMPRPKWDAEKGEVVIAEAGGRN